MGSPDPCAASSSLSPCSQPQGGPSPPGCGGGRSGTGGYGRWRRVPGDDGRLVGRYCSSGGGRACGGQSSSGASTTASGTAAAGDNFAFSPATLKLKVGQKVSTTNKQQGVANTVTADEAPSITVCRADVFVRLHWGGTFAYRCTIHPSMHAFNESSVDPG